MVFRNERTWQNAVEANATEEFHQAYEAAVEQVRKDFGQKHPLLIDGKEVWTRETFSDTSPSNRKLVLGTFSKGGKAHAREAIAAAKKAFPAWAATPWEERVRILRRAADLVAAPLRGPPPHPLECTSAVRAAGAARTPRVARPSGDAQLRASLPLPG